MNLFSDMEIQPAYLQPDLVPATASIMLRLRQNMSLGPKQIQGIQRLVGSSVEGLDPNMITVVDAFGNVLSEEMDPLARATAKQLEMQRNVEAYFEKRTQSIMDRVLGPDQAFVRVSVELDFDQPRHIQGDSSRASLRLDTDHLRLSMTHTKELFDETTKKMFGRFYGMIKSLNEFDSTKIRSVVQGQLNLSENEKCVFALYLRVAGNISSVIKLSDVKDFQAVIALSRMILELALDVKLIADGSIENGVEKALGFHDIRDSEQPIGQ